MPPAQQSALASLVLAIGIAVTAALLALLLVHDRRRRGADLSPEDAEHFARQDARRLVGVAVMLLLAAGVVVGTRVPHEAAGHANPRFVQIWLGVFLLIFFLFFLGILDWLATRAYAHRHRQAITRERLNLLRDELQRRAYPTNGQQPSSNALEEPPL